MPAKRIDQFDDRRRSILGQLHRQHIPKFDSVKLVHERTLAHWYDIDGCRYEVDKKCTVSLQRRVWRM
jgi:hypothetical protein